MFGMNELGSGLGGGLAMSLFNSGNTPGSNTGIGMLSGLMASRMSKDKDKPKGELSDEDRKALAAKMLMNGADQLSQHTPISGAAPVQRQGFAPQQVGMVNPSGR